MVTSVKRAVLAIAPHLIHVWTVARVNHLHLDHAAHTSACVRLEQLAPIVRLHNALCSVASAIVQELRYRKHVCVHLASRSWMRPCLVYRLAIVQIATTAIMEERAISTWAMTNACAQHLF